jgi:hypothetical protein
VWDDCPRALFYGPQGRKGGIEMNWLKGLAAAFVGGAANMITVVVVDPQAFNLGDQWKKTAIAALVGGVLAAAGYLKQSPIPPDAPTQ